MTFTRDDMRVLKNQSGGTLKDVIIPEGYTSIGEYAFSGCTSLTSVTIPDSVTSIGEYAFYGCTSLTSLTIPNGVTSIGADAFSDCTSLTSVTIPNSVTSIGEGAFYDCTSLISVTIPDSVTSIGEDAFSGCTSLTSRIGNFKAFNFSNDEIKCRDYVFTEGKWSKKIKDINLCYKGYHFCKNLFEVFNYYFGEIDKDIVIYECEVGEIVISDDYLSKCVTDRIRPVRRLSRLEVLQELNRRQA